MGAGVGALSARLINGIVFDGLVATGTTQADALLLPGDVNVVSVVTANSGVVLPPIPQPSDEIMVTNLGANMLNVYAFPGGTIQGVTANTPFQLPSGASASFVARAGSSNWVVLSSGGSITPPAGGALNFSMPANSGLLVLLEDI